ncbi:MAG TPA: hypothetical protein PLD85_01905 [Spirochaetota bacterium]|nr:hypothetical protein [Spirochaetota bacterium]
MRIYILSFAVVALFYLSTFGYCAESIDILSGSVVEEDAPSSIDLNQIKKDLEEIKLKSKEKLSSESKNPSVEDKSLKSNKIVKKSKNNKSTKRTVSKKKEKAIAKKTPAAKKSIAPVSSKDKEKTTRDITSKSIESIKLPERLFQESIVQEEKKQDKKVDTEKYSAYVDTIIINPSNLLEGLKFLSYRDLFNWAKFNSLQVFKDSPPVVDNYAFYMLNYKKSFLVEGYQRDLIYYLYIDFVRFKGRKNIITSKLRISIKNIYEKVHTLAELNESILSQDYCIIPLPYEVTIHGKFYLLFDELSDTPGKWGIWDIIISSKKLREINFIQIDPVPQISN